MQRLKEEPPHVHGWRKFAWTNKVDLHELGVFIAVFTTSVFLWIASVFVVYLLVWLSAETLHAFDRLDLPQENPTHLDVTFAFAFDDFITSRPRLLLAIVVISMGLAHLFMTDPIARNEFDDAMSSGRFFNPNVGLWLAFPVLLMFAITTFVGVMLTFSWLMIWIVEGTEWILTPNKGGVAP